MFESLPAKFEFPKAEENVLKFWEERQIFEKSLEQRRDAERFVFYEGPPTANGLPHPGHCLTRTIKDLFPRYQTMCGKLVDRKAGWDTHGLPVEVEVCKELGIHTKEEIEAYGVEKFVRLCIESVFRYTREWEYMTKRLGFWVNLADAYVTFHQSYVESVWWGLKTLFERGLLYQGHKVVWWWAQGGTALSAGEVGEGYRTVDDPSVYVLFPLVDEPPREQNGVPVHRTSLLVWTTTPWTLISNHFAAVHPDVEYALVYDEGANEDFYIAAALVETIAKKVKRELTIVKTIKGSKLLGKRYVPPFDTFYRFAPPDARVFTLPSMLLEPLTMAIPAMTNTPAGDVQQALADGGTDSLGWRVLDADFVTLDSGTGIVHLAPAFGEVDFERLQKERERFVSAHLVPLLNAVDPDGEFACFAPTAYQGRWVKECDRDIIRELKERGLLFHQEQVRHEYPFCPRAEDDALIQYARKSWFVRTSQFKEEFLRNNAQVHWLPDHIREGRFGDFLRNNVDWALSRERFWGTPLPIWACEKTGKMEAIGSYGELLAKPGVEGVDVWEQAKQADPELPDHLKVHKPYIDAVTYDSPFAPGARMRRVPEVIDCWWDAGSMPFAQWGFPHAEGSIERFKEMVPANFISEAIDQTRGWFYGLLAISTLLFGEKVAVRTNKRQTTDKGGAGVSPARITDELLIRKRRKLPHWEAGGSTYFVTFRVKHGELSPPERDSVLDACQHWDEERMLLHAAAVMPDHVHLLLTPLEKTPGEWWSLSELLHGIKGVSAKAINKHRDTAGGIVWQDDRYDRLIRNEDDFNEKRGYILENAAKQGLGEPYSWLWLEPSHSTELHGGRDARSTIAPEEFLENLRGNYPHPYRACIVLGLMLGEDGLKMSKRKKNYREPSYVFDHYGADALRWYLYSGQTPWTGVRFQEASIRDAHREFLVRLHNVFSFFNIYANIDGFSVKGQPTGWRPVSERSELDRWISSELHGTTQTMRKSLDNLENFPAAQRLIDLVDALSNWYVRRSRDRFWRSEKNQDKWDAYNTLYEVLVTLSKLIAPFTPFFAETMYQNLVVKADGGQADALESVHLCDYPQADESLINEELAQEMWLVRQIVSQGRAARTTAKLKVRQPLALAEIILARHEHASWLKAHAELIAEELNIKQVEFTTEADHYVTYQVKPNFKALGPKFGKQAPQVAKALQQADAAEARRQLVEDGKITLTLDGAAIELTDEDVEIRLEAKPGWSAAQGRGGVVVVSTELTTELLEEGLIRELIHHVQGLRREHDLAYEARITLYVDGPAELGEVLRRHAATVERECLVSKIEYAAPSAGDMTDVQVEEYAVRLAIAVVA